MKRSALFASPLALGMGVQVQPAPGRFHVLPPGSIGLAGRVVRDHIEMRDGRPVRVTDAIEVDGVSLLRAPTPERLAELGVVLEDHQLLVVSTT